jgi:DNA polymerase-3 subunit epsilon
VDVYRLWRRAIAEGRRSPAPSHDAPASLFRGTLSAAYYWATGEELEGAHDALIDVHATIEAGVGLDPKCGNLAAWQELAILSQSPLPGFADLDGKLRWSGRDLVFTFGKHAGESLRRVCDRDTSYLRWVLGADFPDDFKAIVKAARRGMHPNPPASE